MSPKEKAKELVEMFMNIKQQKLSDYSIIYYPTAKQCALISVNEAIKFEIKIVKEVEFLAKEANRSFRCDGLFWQEVKKEIEKL